jgi:hypothetical protein
MYIAYMAFEINSDICKLNPLVLMYNNKNGYCFDQIVKRINLVPSK